MITTKYFSITFQDALDRENHSSSTLKNAISNGSLDQVQNNGCLPQCISVDIRRRPISALAANSFWSGVSEIKDVLTTGKFGKYWIYLVSVPSVWSFQGAELIVYTVFLQWKL